MSRRRNQREPWLRRIPAYAPPLAVAGAASVGALWGPLGAILFGGVAAAGAAYCAQRRTKLLQTATLDIDSAIVGRAMFANRAPSAEERRIIQNANHSVRSSVQRTLQMLRAALRAQSAVVLWARSNDHTVRVREAETCSDHLRGGTFDARAGVLGHIHGDAAVINHADDPAELFPWYAPGFEPSSAIAVPLVRDGIPLGCLVVDRAASAPAFDDIDVIAVTSAAEQVALAIHMEFLVLEAANAARDIAVLDAAAPRLNRALTIEDVCREAQDILTNFVDFDFMAVTETDLETGVHTVLHATGAWSDDLVGYQFPMGNDTVSRATTRNEALPYSGRHENPGESVFGDRRMPQAGSLLVLPLNMPQGVIGSLTLAARRTEGFSGTGRNLLSILVNHVAAALSNALAYSRMVRMATTDGMTNLTNHSTFKILGEQALARANRSGRPLCAILTDIDHFKAVNDTHGHAVGDLVIQGVAKVLANSARDVDIVARYGGEEFALVLEECDIDSASLMAERIRERVADLTFDGVDGPFKITLSLGVAELEDEPLNVLVERADQALYSAKRGGRNQVRQYDAAGSAAA